MQRRSFNKCSFPAARFRLAFAVPCLVLAQLFTVVPGAHSQELSDRPSALVKTMVLPDAVSGITRTYFGEISAKETVSMGFQVGGRVVEFNALEGELIPKGALVARLDPIPFDIAVEQAELNLEQAERQLSRFEQLVGNAVAEAQLLDARTAVRLAEVRLRDAEYARDQSMLSAPFDALVAGRSVANFSTVSSGSEIVRLHDMSELRVDIEVPEALIQQLGAEPVVTMRARFPGRDSVYALEFREMNAEISEVGQTFRVTLALDAPKDRLLYPGSSVVVEAVVHEVSSGISVPITAIDTDSNGQTSVLTVAEVSGELVLERAPVELSVLANGDIVVEQGLEPGAEIVVSGVQALADGQLVERFEANF